jgi:hypothetical protein
MPSGYTNGTDNRKCLSFTIKETAMTLAKETTNNHTFGDIFFQTEI